MYRQRSIPEEMPDQKEMENEKSSVISSPLTLINTEEKDNKQKGYMLENRLELIWIPTVILPWRRSKRTLKNRVKKHMWDFKETWNWFRVYFDWEPVREWKVDGYIVELWNKFEKYDFQFKDEYYKVGPYKFDEIEWAKSKFYDVLDNNDDYQKTIKWTNKGLMEAFEYKNNGKR